MSKVLFYVTCKAQLPRVFAVGDPTTQRDIERCRDKIVALKAQWVEKHPDIELVRGHTVVGLDHAVETPDSSNIERLTYFGATRTLEVRFNNGGIYLYRGVEPLLFQSLITAQSVGKAFEAAVKRTGYPFEQVV